MISTTILIITALAIVFATAGLQIAKYTFNKNKELKRLKINLEKLKCDNVALNSQVISLVFYPNSLAAIDIRVRRYGAGFSVNKKESTFNLTTSKN